MNKTTWEKGLRLSSLDIALVATFAALSAIIIKILPGIPIVGVSDANIKFDAVLAPIYGLILGPYLGFTAALFGGLITAGTPFDVLTSFSPAISALTAGFLTQKSLGGNESKVKGWMAAAAILILLISGWYLTDTGRQAPFYPIMHIFGLVFILATRDWTAKAFGEWKTEQVGWRAKPTYYLSGIIIIVLAYVLMRPISSDAWILPYMSLPLFLIGGVIVVYSLFGIGRSSFVLSLAMASYCGVIADHMLGNLVFLGSINVFFPLSQIEEYFLKPLGVPSIPALFTYMMPVSALERILFTVIATIISIGLILALRRANLLSRRP